MTYNRFMGAMSNGGLVAGEALTDDQLRRRVPSIFATQAHESRSDRFVVVPTIDILTGLRREGFDPFFAQQANTRIVGKAAFTKHMLRLRHRLITNADGEAFEIILVNANDGTSSYQMVPGFFRFVCANGLMVGDSFNEVKVRHSGNAIHEVVEGAYSVLEDAPKVAAQVAAFKTIRLDKRERRVFAEVVHELRFPEAHREDGKPAPVEADALLKTRRSADRVSDLWTVGNILQENVIKGGLYGRVKDANGRTRRQRTRAVRGIDQSKALNRAIWSLTEKMAELKGVELAA